MSHGSGAVDEPHCPRCGRALSERVDPLTMLPLDGSAADKERIDRAHDDAFTFAGWAMRLLFGWL